MTTILWAGWKGIGRAVKKGTTKLVVNNSLKKEAKGIQKNVDVTARQKLNSEKRKETLALQTQARSLQSQLDKLGYSPESKPIRKELDALMKKHPNLELRSPRHTAIKTGDINRDRVLNRFASLLNRTTIEQYSLTSLGVASNRKLLSPKEEKNYQRRREVFRRQTRELNRIRDKHPDVIEWAQDNDIRF
jgi:hypothetical protein